jgi:ABC-2 type transport system ATP-binding protein
VPAALAPHQCRDLLDSLAQIADSEVQQLVDHVVIISQGRLVRQGTLAELADLRAGVSVRTPQAAELRAALQRASANGARIEQTGPDSLRVTGMAPAKIGHLACVEGLELHQLTAERGDLKQAFFALTAQPSQDQEPAHPVEEVR